MSKKGQKRKVFFEVSPYDLLLPSGIKRLSFNFQVGSLPEFSQSQAHYKPRAGFEPMPKLTPDFMR